MNEKEIKINILKQIDIDLMKIEFYLLELQADILKRRKENREARERLEGK